MVLVSVLILSLEYDTTPNKIHHEVEHHNIDKNGYVNKFYSFFTDRIFQVKELANEEEYGRRVWWRRRKTKKMFFFNFLKF